MPWCYRCRAELPPGINYICPECNELLDGVTNQFGVVEAAKKKPIREFLLLVVVILGTFLGFSLLCVMVSVFYEWLFAKTGSYSINTLLTIAILVGPILARDVLLSVWSKIKK